MATTQRDNFTTPRTPQSSKSNFENRFQVAKLDNQTFQTSIWNMSTDYCF